MGLESPRISKSSWHDVKVVLEDSNVSAKHFPPGMAPKYALEWDIKLRSLAV